MQENERQRVPCGKFATFFPKLLLFSPPKMDEFNFRLAQYCINKIFELTKSCTWVISKWMQWSGNWTSCHVVLVWNHTCDFKSKLHCALVLFGNHAYDFSPNCTPLSSITIINHYWFQTRCNISRRMKENTAWLHNISPELDHPFCLWTPSFTSLKSNNELNVF